MKVKDFYSLIEYAKQHIVNLDSSLAVIVFETDKGVVYSEKFSVCEDYEYAFIDKMRASSDYTIKKIVCMFNNGQLDVPSFALRKTLIELNESNKDADILLLSSQGLCTRKLKQTF